jgi:hypothetical protein
MAEETAVSASTPGRPRWSVAPYFIVDDVVATANYYREMLGFEFIRKFMLRRLRREFRFCLCPECG